MKLPVLLRGVSLATVATALLFAGGVSQAAADEAKAAKKPDLTATKKLDLNKATSAELERLPGIGPALSKKIVEKRPYRSVDDLTKAGISAPEIRKISPLARWSAADVADYTRRHAIPLLPLYELGYTSIGCEPCTSLPLDPNNPRSGRWQGQKLECGIHIQAGQAGAAGKAG